MSRRTHVHAAPAPSAATAPRAPELAPKARAGVAAALAGPGKPLDATLRAQMQARFGHDFGRVRLHTGGAAAASAAALGAQAYTTGHDIVLAGGRGATETAAGRELVAHELAHVAQQQRGGASGDAEARADAVAARALRGASIDPAALGGAPAGGVQCKPDDPAPAAQPEVDVVTGAGPVVPSGRLDATVLDGFVRDKATLTKRHHAAIEQIAFSIWLNLSLYADAKATIRIAGHTDTTGTETHNEGLSAERAANAKAALEAALAKQGIAAAKLAPIETSSHGEARLRVPTADGVDEPGNRRVEIDVTIEVKAPLPSPDAPKATPPLPGTPGGPKIWEVPGLIDDLDEPRPRVGPRAPKTEGEWLEEALKRDPLLRKLPKWAREKAIGALKDADEKAADAVIDALPLDDAYKGAAKAAMKALLQTLKGRKFKPPPEQPGTLPDEPPAPAFPKAPGEMIFKLPPIRF